MNRRFQPRLPILVASFILTLASLGAGLDAGAQDSSKRGRKYQPPPPTARVEVTVLKDVNGKPIENAAVIFHPLKAGKDDGNMELKTNEDGKAIIDVLPLGEPVRLQIIAKGFQTFGDDYKIDKAEVAIEVRMKRPGEQYSIYKNHSESAQGGKTPDANPDGKPAPAAVPAATEKPAAPPPATSTQPQPK
ncbi:MAG: carboxypeptidase-like regulatory domain-containing protein [Terracidiphilus sp.]|jgi:hypothetical protein